MTTETIRRREPSAAVRNRVVAARKLQARRFDHERGGPEEADAWITWLSPPWG